MNWAGVVRCRLRLLRHHLFAGGKTRGAASPQRPLLGATLAVALAFLIGMGLAGLFGQLSAEGASAAEGADALALVLTLAIFGLLVFDLHEAVSTLVTDSDLELLRRAPIAPATLFLLKLGDVFPRTSVLVVVLAIPAAVAYHLFFPLPAWAWLVLPIQLFSLWAIPLGIGIVISVLLLRRIPARRAREALGLLSTVTLFVLWLLNSFLMPRLAAPTGDPFENLREVMSRSASAIRWSPGAWAASALGQAAGGAVSPALGWTVALAGTAVLVLAVAAWIASLHLDTLQIALTLSPKRKRPPSATRGVAPAIARDTIGAPAAAAATRPARTASVMRAILVRDARLFFRDWTLLGDVITAAILWTLLPLVGEPLYHAAAPVLGRAMLIALTVGLGYEVAARSFPFERHGWTWMRLAPIRRSAWIAARMAAAAIVSVPLVLIASASMALTLDLGPLALARAFALVLPALALSLSVGIWTGAAFANPAWTNPRGMLTATGRVLATALLLVQAAGWLGLAALLDARLFPLPGIAWLIPTLVAVVLSFLPLHATARLVARREWRT